MNTVAKPIRVLSDYVGTTVLADVALVVSYAILIGISGQFSFHLPFTPVPVTAQTFVVLLGASALGSIRSIIGTSIFLLVGAAGVPWFAGGTGGIAIFSEPTFGYIIGFIVSAAVIGVLAARGFDRKVLGTTTEMIIGNVVIYIFGAGFLALSLGLSPAKAIALGVVPFLIGDAVKIVLASVALPSAWKFVERSSK
ncbi:MAG: biotin transporter BioY [Actinomycetota bacterium]|nr:biotin transporter BioY [Actinomycetota bacterium]